MLIIAKIFALITAAVLQMAGPTPLLIGSMGTKLTEKDVAEIVQLIESKDKRPWLLYSELNQGGGWSVRAFLPPEMNSQKIRRGRVILIVTLRPTTGNSSKGWSDNKSELYAQVAMENRPFDQILGDRDTNLPFVIRGHFEDEELVSLMDFVRSNRTNHDPVKAIQGSWPVIAVSKKSDGTYQVALSAQGFGVQAVNLVRKDGKWIVTRIQNGSV